MRKVSKKLLTVIIMVMMIFQLAACKGSNNDKSSGNDNSTEVTKTPDKDADDVTLAGDDVSDSGDNASDGRRAEYEGKNLNGRTIKIGLWWDEYWDSRYQTLDDVEAAAGSISNTETMQMRLDTVRAIEKKWNCKIEWVNLGWEGIQQSINTSVVAGTPECDIYLSSTSWVLPAIANGYAQKISDYAPADSDILNNQEIFKAKNILGQSDYSFHNASIYPSSAYYLVYNKNMLDSLGLEDPNDLAERGEWTWEKFAEYCKACTRDTDGDSVPDVYGYGSVWGNTVSGFLASNNAELVGSGTEGLSSKASIEAFDFIERLYNVDKTARPYMNDWNNDKDSWMNNQVAFAFLYCGDLQWGLPQLDYTVNICPSPIGPSGDGSMTVARFIDGYFIPVGVADATSVYCVFEELQNWFNYDISYRDDAEWWESMFNSQEQFDLGMELGFKSNNDLWTQIDSNNAVGNVFYSVVVDKTSTVAQAIEANKQILQDEISIYVK